MAGSWARGWCCRRDGGWAWRWLQVCAPAALPEHVVKVLFLLSSHFIPKATALGSTIPLPFLGKYSHYRVRSLPRMFKKSELQATILRKLGELGDLWPAGCLVPGPGTRVCQNQGGQWPSRFELRRHTTHWWTGWICRVGGEELLGHPRSVPPQVSSTLLCDKKDTYPVAAAGRWYV